MALDSIYQPAPGALQRFTRVWNRLVEPPAAIQDIERRRQLQLMQGIALITFVLDIAFGVLLIPLATQPDAPFQSPFFYSGVAAAVFLMVVYFLGHAGRYRSAGVTMISIVLMGAWIASTYYSGFAFIMTVAGLFTFLFFPGLAVMATAVISLIGLGLLWMIEPETSWQVMLPLAVGNTILPSLFYVFRRHLDSVAEEQRAILQKQNDILTRQASEIDKVFRAAAIGDFDARAQVYGSDELGRAAEGVNAMLGQLGNLIQTAQSERTTFMESFGGVVALADIEGNITYMNLAGAQMAGYDDPARVIGQKTLSDFLPLDDWEKTMKVGIPTAIDKGAWSGENRLLRFDGTVLPVDQTLFVVRDEQGRPLNLGTIMTDISARKEAETNLAAALNAANMAYVEIDVVKQVIHYDDNFIKIYGTLSGQEGRYEMPLATYMERHLPSDARRSVQLAIQEAITTPNPDYTTELTYHIIRANSAEGVVTAFARIRKDAAGNTTRILTTNQDITMTNAIEAQIAAQNETLGNALEELQKLIANVETAASQVASASESIVDVITLLTGQATTSARLAEQAAANAQAGDQAVTDTILAMGRIRESSQETTRRIKRLGEASQEIGEAVRLIDEIADRVTILALNASIQAAAAGEAGRGFAVVAEEVQRLAERATNATRQIENMVKSIQGEIGEAVIGVEEATHEVVDGSQLAQSAGERISDLNHTVMELSNLVQHVADTTSVQTTEALASLAALAADLQSSVSALNIPAEESSMSGNGSSKMSLHIADGIG
jgi:PAS domain S-box-containing protein